MSTITGPRFRVSAPFVWLGNTFIKIMGWQLIAPAEFEPKWIGVIAPHTSNWDFVYLLAISFVLKLPAYWIGKHTLFPRPFGWIMRRLGGIPIDRRSAQNIVAQIVAAFDERDQLVLGVTPEGTRSYTDHWKTGFYRIAQGADIPIHLVKLDYARKIATIGPPFIPTGDLDADMEQFRDFFSDVTPKYPEKTSDIRVRRRDSSKKRGIKT